MHALFPISNYLQIYWRKRSELWQFKLFNNNNNNNNVISSNYLIVSGEHSVHFNTNVCSRFCCTTHPFQAFGYPLLLLYMGGLVFILVFRQECVPLQRCTLRLSVLWHNSIGSLFLSTCTTTWHTLFGFLPVPCVHCWGFRDCGTPQRSAPRKESSTSTNNP